MITYITGLPGAGKTLHLIKEALTDPNYQGRPIYYIGIEECTVEGWIKIDEEQLNRWYELPESSVILIDEVQDYWRARTDYKQVPVPIQKLEKHRHGGYDFIATSQFPRQTDTLFRGVIGRHFHYERMFGFNTIRKFEFQKCVVDPANDYFSRKDALTSTEKLDKKYFGLYKSSVDHTHKRRVPKKLYVLALGIVAVVTAFLFLPSMILTTPEAFDADKVATSFTSDVSAQLNTTRQNSATETHMFSDTDSFLKHQTPLIPNRPDTAPIYAELHKAVSMPRPNCLSYERRGQVKCECYSQQATKMAIDHSVCLYYVNNGYEFDYTRPDRSESVHRGEEGGTPTPDGAITTVNQSGRPRYPNTGNSYRGIQ